MTLANGAHTSDDDGTLALETAKIESGSLVLGGTATITKLEGGTKNTDGTLTVNAASDVVTVSEVDTTFDKGTIDIQGGSVQLSQNGTIGSLRGVAGTSIGTTTSASGNVVLSLNGSTGSEIADYAGDVKVGIKMVGSGKQKPTHQDL